MRTNRKYTTKHKTVIYGGHESWVKGIQPILKNVKFIYKDMKPTSEQIKSVDMIWIQTNAFCHSFYQKVKKIAEAYSIPIFYFKYASAAKCAEQLIEVDGVI